MPRSARAFKAEACGLEGRLLMAFSPPTPPVQFVDPTVAVLGTPWPFQVVTQRAGQATVTLSRTDTAGPLQVEVTADPKMRAWSGPDTVNPLDAQSPTGRELKSSVPVAGIVGAVDQTVTFAPGQSLATVTVPIIAGAPNPGAVDVTLRAAVIGTPSPGPSPMPLDLRVVASDPTLPPKVASVLATDRGIVVSFNKPMDPAGASNVNNYRMFQAKSWTTYTGILKYPKFTTVVKPARFESAQYDPATQTVTLIGKQPILYGWSTIWSQMNRPRGPVRTAHSPHVARGLTDLQGNPINANTTPGKVAFRALNPTYGL